MESTGNLHEVHGESSRSPRRVFTESSRSPRGVFMESMKYSLRSPHGVPVDLWTPRGLHMDSMESPCGLLEMLNVFLLKSMESPQSPHGESPWSPHGVCENVWGSVKYSQSTTNRCAYGLKITDCKTAGDTRRGSMR
jgi:hypothetical protein